jgi:hypothetical protein
MSTTLSLNARAAISAIVAQTTKEDSSINTDDAWQQALKSLEHRAAYEVMCHNALIQLLNMSPAPVFAVEKPE